MLQVMIKSQKNQKITAYKFMPMSMATFSNVRILLKSKLNKGLIDFLFQIMQTSYSYFTILRTLYD